MIWVFDPTSSNEKNTFFLGGHESPWFGGDEEPPPSFDKIYDISLCSSNRSIPNTFIRRCEYLQSSKLSHSCTQGTRWDQPNTPNGRSRNFQHLRKRPKLGAWNFHGKKFCFIGFWSFKHVGGFESSLKGPSGYFFQIICGSTDMLNQNIVGFTTKKKRSIKPLNYQVDLTKLEATSQIFIQENIQENHPFLGEAAM